MNANPDNLRCGAAGCRGPRGSGGRGPGGRNGAGFADGARAGRMLAQGDLRLIALALIAEQPRHGYDIIKLVEDTTAGSYAPSPGLVYPVLTYLEDLGYVTPQPDGARKLYVITATGRSHLADNLAIANAVFDRLAAFGDRAGGRRSRNDDCARGDGQLLPPLLRAALFNLRDVAARQLFNNPDSEAELIAILARAASELRRA